VPQPLPVVAARGFEHNQRGLQRLEPDDKGGDPRLIVRDRPAFARGPQGDLELRCGDVQTNKERKR
jgi:hypothetical protein